MNEFEQRLIAARPRTCEANRVLVDEFEFSPTIKRGALVWFPGNLRWALAHEGLTYVTYSTEDEAYVRVSVRAYGEWLIRVAEYAK